MASISKYRRYKSEKNFQIDPQQRRYGRKAKRPVSEGVSLCYLSNYREASLAELYSYSVNKDENIHKQRNSISIKGLENRVSP